MMALRIVDLACQRFPVELQRRVCLVIWMHETFHDNRDDARAYVEQMNVWHAARTGRAWGRLVR